MGIGSTSLEFRLEKIDETRHYLLEKTKYNELINKKQKKICTTLNYIEHLLILASTVAGCVSISVFASLADIPIGTSGSTY